MTRTNEFLRVISEHYAAHSRDMPWRLPEPDGSFDPYKILVSEIMLQQTQVARVIPKFLEFLSKFPDMKALAGAGLPQVLAAWSGLGYNRRAKYLHEAAKELVSKYRPWELDDLVVCKGIGPNTAAAVLAYSYDLPVIFIETNIRSVIIHHFFQDKEGVHDKEILATLGQIVPWKNGQDMSPREFYWAMMDYGTYLKAAHGNPNKRSKTYSVQSKFPGSKRQVRGRIIRELLAGPRQLTEVSQAIQDDRFEDILSTLREEKLVELQGNVLMLYNGGRYDPSA